MFCCIDWRILIQFPYYIYSPQLFTHSLHMLNMLDGVDPCDFHATELIGRPHHSLDTFTQTIIQKENFNL